MEIGASQHLDHRAGRVVYTYHLFYNSNYRRPALRPEERCQWPRRPRQHLAHCSADIGPRPGSRRRSWESGLSSAFASSAISSEARTPAPEPSPSAGWSMPWTSGTPIGATLHRAALAGAGFHRSSEGFPTSGAASSGRSPRPISSAVVQEVARMIVNPRLGRGRKVGSPLAGGRRTRIRQDQTAPGTDRPCRAIEASPS